MKFELTQPCKECPFRNDIKGYLTKARIQELDDALHDGTFACHKTTVSEEDETGFEYRVSNDDSQHCAGALILLEKMGRSSNMMRVAERLGLYDHTKLKMDSPVFDDFEEMEDAQSR